MTSVVRDRETKNHQKAYATNAKKKKGSHSAERLAEKYGPFFLQIPFTTFALLIISPP